MKIIKEGSNGHSWSSLEFYKQHYHKLGDVNYIVLYYAEEEWCINHDLFHQYVIVIGEKAQIWVLTEIQERSLGFLIRYYCYKRKSEIILFLSILLLSSVLFCTLLSFSMMHILEFYSILNSYIWIVIPLIFIGTVDFILIIILYNEIRNKCDKLN